MPRTRLFIRKARRQTFVPDQGGETKVPRSKLREINRRKRRAAKKARRINRKPKR